MFLSFFNSLTRSRFISFFSHSFSFILWSAGTAKSTILPVLFFFFFFFCLLLLDLAFWSRLGDPCVCQSPIGGYVCHFLGQVLACAYYNYYYYYYCCCCCCSCLLCLLDYLPFLQSHINLLKNLGSEGILY